MSKLIHLADQLRDIHAEIARLESVVARHPASKSLQIDFQSMSKRRQNLEAEFGALADRQDLDVMRYRFLPESSSAIPLRALTKALDRFQLAVSTIYDAVKTGPKRRPKLSAETFSESGFDFGYTFSGSLGVVLTVPNERMLLDRSKFDMAVEAFFSAAESTSRKEVIAFAKAYGVASVRRVYEWSAAHADFDIAADIHVTRGELSRSRMQVAPKALRHLKQIIEETSDLNDEPHEITGRLAGLDVDKKTFHLVALGGDDIEGKWSGGYTHDSAHVLDAIYVAALVKRTKVHYALEREEVDWLLGSLTPVAGNVVQIDHSA